MSYLGITPGVSEGFPAACIEITPQGIRWLCGEPIPAAVRELLGFSLHPEPVTDTVTRPEPGTPEYEPAPSEPPQEGAGPDQEEPEILRAAPPGLGMLGFLTLLLVSQALSRR